MRDDDSQTLRCSCKRSRRLGLCLFRLRLRIPATVRIQFESSRSHCVVIKFYESHRSRSDYEASKEFIWLERQHQFHGKVRTNEWSRYNHWIYAFLTIMSFAPVNFNRYFEFRLIYLFYSSHVFPTWTKNEGNLQESFQDILSVLSLASPWNLTILASSLRPLAILGRLIVSSESCLTFFVPLGSFFESLDQNSLKIVFLIF